MTEVLYYPEEIQGKFLRSNSFMRVIMGPVGSGKSVTSSVEVIRRASEQEPGPDGIRRSRCAIVRQTVRQLRDTTLKTFMDWFPPGEFGVFMKTSYTYFFKHGDVECEIMFRALERPDDVANLNSLELTFAWFNECRDIRPEIVDAMSKRVGRYPSMKDGVGPTWFGMWGDTNPPTIGTWWWAQMEGIDPEDGVSENPNGWDVYKQPSGLSDKAENVANLPPGYYTRMMGQSKDYQRVYIHGEYGHAHMGQPVYANFRAVFHTATEPLKAINSESFPIVVGMDLGLTPCAVIGQQDAHGRINVLDEIVTKSMAALEFTRDLLRPRLINNYPGMTAVVITDPAGVQRSQTDARTVVDIIRSTGLTVMPAETNTISARINAVDEALMRHIEGEAAFLVDPRCRHLIRAMMGGYRYHEKKDDILKNDDSHIAEALQYFMLHVGRVNGGQVRQPLPVIVSDPVGRFA